jgi:O-antigen/teichoic acid export membrane protein
VSGPSAGGQARLLASGSLVQQAAQVTGLLAMFAIITVLARRLTLGELGIYGLLTSLSGYLLVVQNAGAGAAVRAMAAAGDARGRSAAFSTAAALYALAGLASGIVLAGVGVLLAQGVSVPEAVREQARIGALLLGAVTAVGWPATVYRDALRADQRFVRAALTEIAALLAYVGLVLALVYGGVGLDLVIGASAGIPLLVGIACAFVARASRVPFSFDRNGITRAEAREILGLAGYLSLTEGAATAIYAIDRAILGLFKSAATVGLFEGPVRAHNLVRALNAAVTVTVLPTASRYEVAGDRRRLRELLLRGTRYTLALVVPIAVAAMVMGGPILALWLGPRFRTAGGAMAILMSHWLLNGCSGLLMATLVGVGRARIVARYAVGVAVGNVVLALALTAPLGLEGVAVATAVPYLAMFPVLLRAALSAVPVAARRLALESALPAWSLGAALAAALGALRLTAHPSSGAAVGIAVGGVVAYWIAFYALWLRPHERSLVREVAFGLLPAAKR